MLKLKEVEKHVEKLEHSMTNKNKDLFVRGKISAYFKSRSYGVMFKRIVNGKWKCFPVKTLSDLASALDIIHGHKRENKYSEKILSILAIERANGNSILTFEYIQETLGIDNMATVSQAKRFLNKKGLVADEGPKRLSLIKTNRNYCGHKTCRFLTSKLGRPHFCPIKNHYIDDNHFKEMCGCIQEIGTNEFTPQCPGWWA